MAGENVFDKYLATGEFEELTLDDFQTLFRQEVKRISALELDGRVTTVKQVQFRKSRFNPDREYIVLLMEVAGEEAVFVTGSKKLVQFFKKAEKFLPLLVQWRTFTLMGRVVAVPARVAVKKR